MHDVEEILDLWESTGLLHECPDRYNLALMLHTQKNVNEQLNPKKHNGDYWDSYSEDGPDIDFLRVSIPTVVRIYRYKPSTFQGLLETDGFKDVYKLGYMPYGPNDLDICEIIASRITRLDIGRVYFGGIFLKERKLYLVTDTVE